MFATLVFSTTLQCPIKCKLCGLSCGPHRTERLSLEFMLRMMDEYTKLKGGAHVTFTGGEPFLLKEDLFEAIRHATSKKMTSRVVSNAYWATSPPAAEEMVQRCLDAGLSEINFSVDDMHQEHIPIERIKYAHAACDKLGLPVLLAHKALASSRVTVDALESVLGRPLVNFASWRARHSELTDEEQARDPAPKSFTYSSGGCVPVGHNASDVSEDELSYGRIEGGEHGCCDGIMRDVIISSEEMLELCCGVVNREIPELSIGPLSRDGLFETIKKASSELIVNWLALEGPSGIARYVESKDSALRFEKKYSSKCHLCHDVLTNPRARKLLPCVDPAKRDELRYKKMIYDQSRMNKEFMKKMYPSSI